jgi:hypothetical protein
MKKLYFRASLNIDDYAKHDIKRSDNLFAVHFEKDWAQIVQTWQRECVDANDRRIANGKNCCELEITVKTHFNDRTIKANALMWVIYDLQCEILNREGKYIQHPIKPIELYNQDMEGYAPVHKHMCSKSEEWACISFAESGDEKCDYPGHFVSRTYTDDEKVLLTFRETSSFWDSVAFATFIEYKLAELETMGRDRWNDGVVKGLIDDFMKNIKEKGK